jgi:monothiol glutaredoxin
MKIKAYTRSDCVWSSGVCAVFDKYCLPFENLDVGNDPKALEEMRNKSGQTKTPCVEIDGIFLADICGQEVEDFITSHGLVGRKDAENTASELAGRKTIPGAKLASQTQFF